MGVFPLRRYTELYLDGAWVDISGYVYERDPITITRGRGAEDDRTSPASCTLTLNNRGGVFSPRNPRSPYYGLLQRNTPIRVSVGGPEVWLDIPRGATARAAVASSAALDISGDLDVRIDVAPETWAGGPWAENGLELIGRYTLTGNQRSWRLVARTSGTVEFAHSTTGADYNPWTSPQLPFTGGRRGALRVTLDVNNGTGGHTLTWYTADTLAGPWTALGSETRTGTITLHNPSAPLEIGDAASTVFENGHRRVYGAEVRNGIDGPAVAAPDFTAQAAGATSFVDSAGRTWTLTGGAVLTDRIVRFAGEVVSWPQRWDVSGSDVYVPIEAAGILRRLGQGRKALASTLRRRIPAYAPLAYWPMEDEDGATTAASGLPGGSVLYTLALDFGAESSLAGSSPLPRMSEGSRLNGSVPPPATAATAWHLEFVYLLPEAPASDTIILGAWTTGTVRRWYLMLRSGVATVQGLDIEGNVLVNQLIGIGTNLFSTWTRWQFFMSESGGTVDWTCRWRNVGSIGGQFTGSYSGTVGRVTDVVGPPDGYAAGADGLALGHIAVFPTADTLAYSLADSGYAGETAVSRMARLASEERNTLALAWVDGDPQRDTEHMGPQRPDTLLNLLEDGAEADGGILYEDRRHTRLIYRDRTTLYNQPVALALDYTAGREVAPPLQPEEDDQGLRNDITVRRRGGSWGRAVLEAGPLSVLPPEQGGVGLYDEEVELSLESDAQAEPIAGWLLHLATWDEARYPVVHLALHGAPHLIVPATELDIGDRLTIANPPPWLPPDAIDLLAQGYTETLTAHTWDLTLTCRPAGPWTVGVIEDTVLGRADTDGCTLSADLTDTAATAAVTTATGARWIDSVTFPSEFPFHARIGGEIVEVTGIDGTTLSQTMHITRGVNGLTMAHPAGTPVRLAHPMRLAL